MNWFLHNAVADLYGPYFLLFYGTSIVVLIVASYRSIRAIDQTRDLEPMEIPAKFDPYEIAYLRGRENEVIRVAIASMIQRGLLQIVEQKKGLTTTKLIDRGESSEPGKLPPVEAAIWECEGFPADPRSIFASRGLRANVKEACTPYEIDLDERGLLAPRGEMKELALRLWSFGLAAIVLLGGYKLAVAHAKGHSNVAFLWIMMIGGGLAFTGACWTLPRLSHQGKAHLERLKLAYGGLRAQLDAEDNWTEDGPESAGGKDRTRAAVAHSDCLLLVGIFGISSLAGTPLSDLNTMFARGSSKSGCGGGCGGGGAGCGGGGGGGGCGGGGGGCGGGGCGGGCGGCGG